jgi:hypothetical protein
MELKYGFKMPYKRQLYANCMQIKKASGAKQTSVSGFCISVARKCELSNRKILQNLLYIIDFVCVKWLIPPGDMNLF